MSRRDLERIEVLIEVLAHRLTTESAAVVLDLSIRQTQHLPSLGTNGRPAATDFCRAATLSFQL
jgi:hypothetical protein